MSPTTLIILITVTGIVAVGLAVRGVIRRELSAITDSGGLDPSGGHFKELMDRLVEIEGIAKAVDALRMGLTNVKIRGGWGEVQLELILQDMLTDNQYEKNVETVPGSNRRVEFAVMLPGRGGQKPVWLPIDSKFPLEDYLRLQEAMDAGDTDGIDRAVKGLQTAIIKAAKDIRAKYIAPPHTTEFGVLFLPSEGLCAEALRSTKIEDELRGLRIVLAGPTTISALLHAWRMRFQTLAIEARTSELWDVLSAMKDEFDSFTTELAALKKQLGTAVGTIEKTEKRTGKMRETLRYVEERPLDPSEISPAQV